MPALAPKVTTKSNLGDSASDEIFLFGPFELFAPERLLRRNGQSVAISSRAADTLVMLIERAGEIVSHTDLIARAWPDVTVGEANLRVLIAALRKALGDDRNNSRYISNVAGRGYCFVAKVDRLAAETTVSYAGSTPAVAERYRLPVRMSRLIGREETVSTILTQLLMRRCVSIVGPGGIGKTAVAVKVAHSSVEGFSGGVSYVDLSTLADSKLVSTAVASSLGCMSRYHDPLPALLDYLRDKRLLLVLDNCEAVLGGTAELAKLVVDEAPRVHILVTSREALRIEGEHVHVLNPLDSPPEKRDLTAAEALNYPATQLFLERAAAAGYRAGLSDADAPAVARVCRKMDGIALAIELAASRAGVYGIPETARLLDDRFGLVWKGRRTAEPRHQTLTSMLDWSYRLLSDRERRVLCRLSVFVQDFTIEAACVVAADEDGKDALISDAIARLAAKSLISTKSGGGKTYYRLLDITRAYASVKLRESGLLNDVCKRHAINFCGFLKQDVTTQYGIGENDLSQYSLQVGNIRAALDWALSDDGDPTIGVQLAASAAPLLIRLSLLDECRRYCEKALTALRHEDQGSRSEMILQEAVAYSLMFTRGNSAEVRAALERGLALATTFRDTTRQLHFFAGLNAFLYRVGDFRGALAVARRVSTVAKAADDSAGLIMAEWMLGIAHHCVGNQADAERHCQQGMMHAVAEAVFNPIFFGYDHRIRALVGFSGALWLRGYSNRALRTAQQAIDEAAALDQPVSMCMSLYTAQVFFRAGFVERARELAGRLVEHAERFALGPFRAVGTALMAEFAIASGEAAIGVASLRTAIETLRSDQHNVLYTVLSGALAQGLHKIGRSNEAFAVVNEAIHQAISSGAKFELAELLRLKAEMLASGTQATRAAAVDVLSASLRVAQDQGALAYQLRSATTLARLLSEDGQSCRGREILAPVYDRFTEGFETPDLQTAYAVLQDLA